MTPLSSDRSGYRIAALLALLLLITSAFAWQRYHDVPVEQFITPIENTDGNLVVEPHDHGDPTVTASFLFARIGDEELTCLQRIRPFTRLLLDRTQITDRGLEHVAKVHGLKMLSITDTAITNAGMQTLATLTDLEDLRLDGTQITDAGLESLTKLPYLQWLLVRRTAITDRALETFKKLPHLTSVALLGTKMTTAGVLRLKTDLPQLHIIDEARDED